METINGVDAVLAVWAVAATVTAFGYRRAWMDATEPQDDGLEVALSVSPVGGSGSHLVGDLAAADALIVVPEDATVLEPGTTVQVVRLTRPEEGL